MQRCRRDCTGVAESTMVWVTNPARVAKKVTVTLAVGEFTRGRGCVGWGGDCGEWPG